MRDWLTLCLVLAALVLATFTTKGMPIPRWLWKALSVGCLVWALGIVVLFYWRMV